MDEQMFSSKTESISEEQQADMCTVIFYNGNVRYHEEKVTSGQPVNKPDVDPIRIGYKFTGWYYDISCSQKYSFTSAVTRDISLYADWIRTTYHVRFNANGLAHPTTQVVAHGSLALEPEVSHPGHILEGWYTDDTYTNRYNFNTKVTGPLCLYAKWIPL